MPTSTTPVWFITGCSTGFGKELVRAVLERGWRCVATARNVASLADLAEPGSDADARLARVKLDVTDAAQIAAAVETAQQRFGAIDVLVNNAGYGYQASVEEGDEAEIRAQFDVSPAFLARAITRRASMPSKAGPIRSRRKPGRSASA